MAFIGTPLDTRNTFQSLVGKRFSGDGSTTAFTLDVAPSSTLDIEVFVGNVRQDPNSAYTLSGTTLTITGAPPSGTNNIYVVHQAKSVGTIDPPANISTAQTFSSTLTANGGAVFNEDSADVDFRVESNGNANMLVVNGGEDKVGIGSDPDLGTGLHIKTADSGASVSVHADELVVEGSANSGLSILSGASSNGRIMFGDSGDNDIGYIEYDHSANQLALGANAGSHIKIDSSGHVTMPAQSAFTVKHGSGSVTNVATNNTVSTLVFANEIFDVNSDFNTSNYTFTAPVTGKYLLSFCCTLSNVDKDANYIICAIRTSNRQYGDGNAFGIQQNGGDEPRVEISQTILADMDANDTATVGVQQYEGAAQMDVGADAGFFSGHLVC